MSYFNPDGLLLKFGTEKTTANTGGEYKTVGALRVIEQRIDVSTLTTSAVVVNDTIFWPKGAFLEDVTVETQTAISGGASTFNVGLIQTDRATNVSDTTFVSGLTIAGVSGAGSRTTLVLGSSGAGAGIGTTPIVASATNSGYLTAKIGGGSVTGVFIVRIGLRVDATTQGDI